MRRTTRLSATKALLLLLAATLLGAALPARADQAGQYHPGKFVWFDLVTDDLSAARRFYGSVFGWQFRTVGAAPGSYTFAELAGARIGGMLYRPPPAGAARNARWLALISVTDPASTVRYVEQQGGAVLVPPAAIPGRGTHALFRDPQGAVFGVLRSETGDRPDTPVVAGDFFWIDLLVPNPEHAAEFYSGLAGYEVSPGESESVKRVVLSSGGYARAGVTPMPPMVKQPGWLAYVLVDDVRATLDKVAAGGGKVLVQPRADVLDGNLAVIADPSGGVLGIVRWQTADNSAQGEQ